MVRIPVKLECAANEIEPGGSLRCSLRAYNAADRVDEVTVVLDGPLAPHTSCTPETLPLLPETEGAFLLTVELPAGTRVPAGTQQLLVQAVSGLAEIEPSTEQLSVEVSRHTAATLVLEALPPTEAGQAAYELRVDSTSNHLLDLVVEAEARGGVVIDSRAMQVPPFGQGSARLALLPEPSHTGPVDVAVRVYGDGVDLAAQATWEAEPKPKPRPQPKPTPKPTPSTPVPWGSRAKGCAMTLFKVINVLVVLVVAGLILAIALFLVLS